MEIFHIVIVVFILACLTLLPTVGLRIMKRNAAVTEPTKPAPKQGKLFQMLPYIVLLVGGTYLFITRIIPLLNS